MESYRLFADILEYPQSHPLASLDRLLQSQDPPDEEAASALREFREFLLGCAQEKLEELYTATFDLQPLCYPYVGHQLFGEEFRRGLFMARLKKEYRVAHFDPGSELPDHLCVILRFLAGREAGEFEQDLIGDGLVPALEKMISGAADEASPYLLPLRALLSSLRNDVRTAVRGEP